jgi:outer membrane protein OmpA-like peptidoglycan-associated protein
MRLTKITLFLLILGIFANYNLVKAQDTTSGAKNFYIEKLPEHMEPDSNKIKKRHLDQHEKYINLESPYPAKTRHWSSIVLNGGLQTVSGDVKARMGWVVGGSYRWNLGYIASMRVGARHGVSFGQNYEPKALVGSLEENQLTVPSNSLYGNAGNGFFEELFDANGNFDGFLNPVTGDTLTRLINYADAGIFHAFDNYKVKITELDLSVMFHLNNFKYHRENNWFNAYVFLGAGGMLYKTYSDVLNENGDPYDYEAFFRQGIVNGEFNQDLDDVFADGSVTPSERSTVRDALKDLYGAGQLKRTYESAAEGHKNEENLFSRVFNPAFHVGAAIDFLVHPRISIGLETRHTFANDDLIDGQRWSEQGDLTRDYDTYNQTTLSLAFHIGKKKEKSDLPMWWENPNERTMFMLQQQPDVAKIIEEAVPEDSDNDGIPDKIDEEPNTPEGAIVDSKGNTKDSDGDGCPDHEDPEPYSTPMLKIEDCKNVYDFATKECCDEKTIGTYTPCREVELPTIHFDDDKYYISPEFYAHLHEIARRMQDCPDLKVVTHGHNDTRTDIKYNEQISWNRVNASINFLVDKYGISRDRFIVTYSGKREPLVGDETAASKYKTKKVEFKFAEEGQTGESNPPAPHPGIKAGSDK